VGKTMSLSSVARPGKPKEVNDVSRKGRVGKRGGGESKKRRSKERQGNITKLGEREGVEPKKGDLKGGVIDSKSQTGVWAI